jgi:cholesterol transport system auxiliary component
MRARAALALGTLLVVAGCSLRPSPRPPLAQYDLGPGVSVAEGEGPRLPVVFVVHEATGPQYLVGNDMNYRLLYDGPHRLRRYANSQWAVSPLFLVGERLRGALAADVAHGGAVPDYGLPADYWVRPSVEDLCQVFDSPTQSRGVVRLRVALLRGRSRSFVGQETFSSEVPAATADARGGVSALDAALAQTVSAAASWIVQAVEDDRAASANGGK